MDRLVAVVNWLDGGEHPRLQAGGTKLGIQKKKNETEG